MRFGVTAGALALILAAPLSAEQQVRVFQLHFHSAADATQVVEPLLSQEGSVTLSRPNSLTVRDSSEVLAQIAQALAAWDVAPSNFTVRVRVLLGSTGQAPSGRPAPLVSGIGRELTSVFRFTDYKEIDTLNVVAADGSAVEAQVGGRYHIRFTVRGSQDRVQLSQLEFSRRVEGPGHAVLLRPILKTNVSLGMGQTFILGAARSEEANVGLVLVLWAQREGAE